MVLWLQNIWLLFLPQASSWLFLTLLLGWLSVIYVTFLGRNSLFSWFSSLGTLWRRNFTEYSLCEYAGRGMICGPACVSLYPIITPSWRCLEQKSLTLAWLVADINIPLPCFRIGFKLTHTLKHLCIICIHDTCFRI